MLKHITFLFQKSLIIINIINCCMQVLNYFFEEIFVNNSKRVAKAKKNSLGGIKDSVTNLDKEVADQEDALIICLSLPVKCKHYTTEMKNKIIKILFDVIMKE